MLTTAGAARATESAKLCITTTGRWRRRRRRRAGASEAARAAGAALGGCVPSNAGLHQTTRKATAKPTTTALIKKLTRTRVFCNYYRLLKPLRESAPICV